MVTKNSFYIYSNDEYGKKLIDSIVGFIDIRTLEKILSDSSDIISYKQKTILLKFVRTYYFMDYLDNLDNLDDLDDLDNLGNLDYQNMLWKKCKEIF